jgi:hypothetical protein
MTSRTTGDFWRAYRALPEDVKERARAAYRRFQQDPYHRGLRFRRVHQTHPFYSARVGLHYRAVGAMEGDTIIWFWIGSHAEYDQLVRSL